MSIAMTMASVVAGGRGMVVVMVVVREAGGRCCNRGWWCCGSNGLMALVIVNEWSSIPVLDGANALVA